MSRQSIMDMDLSGRIREIQSAEGRQKQPIEIAGPAGNPTQPGWIPGQIKDLPGVAGTPKTKPAPLEADEIAEEEWWPC